METESRSVISRDSNTPSFTFTFNVVDGREKFCQGDSSTSSSSGSFSLHGCIPPRVGRTSRSPPHRWEVVDTTPATSHQLARTSGGISIPPEIRGSGNQPQCVSQYGQHNSGRLHQQNGGTRSPTLCYLLWDMMMWCLDRGISLRARHLPGKRNHIADALSRNHVVRTTKWTLPQEVGNHYDKFFAIGRHP